MPSAPWRPKEQTNEERAAELEAAEREFVRSERRLLAEMLLGCLAFSLTGLALVGWAVHTNDLRWAGVAFWTGLLIGDLGMIGLLLRHAHRS